MKKDGILVNDLDKKESFTRDRVTEALVSNMYALVRTLSDELEEMDLKCVSNQEFMVAVEGVLRGMYLHEEDDGGVKR